MTDLEKELVEKLAQHDFDRYENGSWESGCREVKENYRIHTEALLPLIRSYTNALVAAAYARATKLIAQVRDDYHSNDGPFDMGMRLQMLENEVCSLTPADAARELERRDEIVLADTIIRFRKMLNRLGIHGYYNEMKREFDLEEVSMSKPTPVERSNENG